MCEECGNLFKNQKELQDHFNTEHSKPQVSTVTSEEDGHKCENSDFKTQVAADLFHRNIYEHNPEEAPKIRQMKPVAPAVIYLLAEQNVVLSEEVKN